MNKPNNLAVCVKAVLCLVLFVTTTGCDGGLFGTGDGSEVILPPDSSGPAATPENPNDVNSNEPDTPTLPPAGSDITSFDQQFENQLITGNNDLPLVILINHSSQPINMISGESLKPLLTTALSSGSASAHVEIANDQIQLSIIASDSSHILFRFTSIELAPSTLTTLIAYDTPDASDKPGTSSTLGVIALRTLTSSTDPSIATLRIVQASQLGTSDKSAIMTLIPEGANPGSGEVNFDNISLTTAPDSKYMSVNEGTYQLKDSLDRFDPVSLSIEANTVYSLIITGAMNPVVFIAIDSDVIIQPNATKDLDHAGSRH